MQGTLTMEHNQHHVSTFQIWTDCKMLIEDWSLNTTQGFVGALVFSAFLSMVYEGSKFYYHIGKVLHYRKSNRWQGRRVGHYVSRGWKALAYLIHFTVGYTLMLCAMTFNVWLILAVCFGAGSGYFFLRPLIQHVLHVQSVNITSAASEHGVPLVSAKSSSSSNDESHCTREDVTLFVEESVDNDSTTL